MPFVRPPRARNRIPLLLVPVALAASIQAQDPGVPAADPLAGTTSRDRFDTTFNPAFSVAFDLLAEAGDLPGGGDRFNRLRVRSVELGTQARIDPLGWAYMSAAFADEGPESVVELEEAAIWFEDLPDTFSLRAGRFLADFGKVNTVHTHDKPFPHEDLVRAEYFGGPLFLTGLELHHWFGLGEVPVRWSLGLSADAEGDDHDAPLVGGGGHEETGFLVGRRGLDNQVLTARVTAQHDLSAESYLQWGLSGFYAPGMPEFEEVPLPGGGVQEERHDLRKAVVALDLTWSRTDLDGRSADRATMEIWHHQGQSEDPAGGLRSGGHEGLWGVYEHAFSSSWSAGIQASWYQLAAGEGSAPWFSGEEAGARRGIFLTWHLSEFQRLRAAILHQDPGAGLEPFVSVSLQWVALLGSHVHPMDW